MRDKVPWELEGRDTPIWDSLGSGLMGSRISPISVHTLAHAPDPALTSAEKGQHWARGGGLSPGQQRQARVSLGGRRW